jgi:hypothetical protein
MHPRRLLRKGVEDARPAAEAHSELLTFADRAMPRSPTGSDRRGYGSADRRRQRPPKIELGGASAAASPICAAGALKPGSGAAEIALGPCDRHPLSATGPLRRHEDANKYDPDGLFFVHHGVGSEDWSADGFEKLSAK